MNDDNLQKSKSLTWWKVTLMYIGLMFTITLLMSLVNKDKMFYNLSASIIISWIIAMVAYYFWAINFYNVNMGWEDADWDRVNKIKRGQPGLVDDEPTKNPNSEETLGLPPGTVRATLALTLLVNGLALMLASMEMPYTLEQNQLFVDNYEFLKTAFLMMVAFYFGNKSLDFLKSRNPVYGQQTPHRRNLNEGQNETLNSPVMADESLLSVTSTKNLEIEDDRSTKDFEDKAAQG